MEPESAVAQFSDAEFDEIFAAFTDVDDMLLDALMASADGTDFPQVPLEAHSSQHVTQAGPSPFESRFNTASMSSASDGPPPPAGHAAVGAPANLPAPQHQSSQLQYRLPQQPLPYTVQTPSSSADGSVLHPSHNAYPLHSDGGQRLSVSGPTAIPDTTSAPLQADAAPGPLTVNSGPTITTYTPATGMGMPQIVKVEDGASSGGWGGGSGPRPSVAAPAAGAAAAAADVARPWPWQSQGSMAPGLLQSRQNQHHHQEQQPGGWAYPGDWASPARAPQQQSGQQQLTHPRLLDQASQHPSCAPIHVSMPLAQPLTAARGLPPGLQPPHHAQAPAYPAAVAATAAFGPPPYGHQHHYAPRPVLQTQLSGAISATASASASAPEPQAQAPAPPGRSSHEAASSAPDSKPPAAPAAKQPYMQYSHGSKYKPSDLVAELAAEAGVGWTGNEAGWCAAGSAGGRRGGAGGLGDGQGLEAVLSAAGVAGGGGGGGSVGPEGLRVPPPSRGQTAEELLAGLDLNVGLPCTAGISTLALEPFISHAAICTLPAHY